MGLLGCGVIVPWFIDPVPQDLSYHRFADTTAWLGIPNFVNVFTNAGFILVGFMGLSASRTKRFALESADMQLAYHVFFIGVGLVGMGSAYYHVNPNNATLLWDRLPMTVSFMALLAMILADTVSPKIGKVLLWPLIGMGVGSVGYWYVTELWGVGDLRPYGVVQFLPMILISVILGLFGTRFMRSSFIWAILGTYLLAKIVEFFDAEIYSITQIISGHSLKHVIAALATAWVIFACQQREVGHPESSNP